MEVSPLYDKVLLQKLQQLSVHNKRAVMGFRQGVHVSHKKGSGLEFYEHKSYSPGDDFRAIDWGAVARTGKTYVRRYREEQDAHVVVLLDTSYSVAADARLSTVALSIIYAALCSGDSVSLNIAGVSSSPRMRNPKLFRSLLSQVENAQAVKTFPLLDSVREVLQGKSTSQRVFIVSDFFIDRSELHTALQTLKRKNAEVSLLAFESVPFDTLPESGVFVDQETNEEIEVAELASMQSDIASAYASHRAYLSSEAGYFGYDVVSLRQQRSIEDILFYDLRIAKILV